LVDLRAVLKDEMLAGLMVVRTVVLKVEVLVESMAGYWVDK